MYYYFDGKEDLYAHVARVELERLFARVGPFAGAGSHGDADAFWSALENYYLRLMTALADRPQAGGADPGLDRCLERPRRCSRAQQEMEQAVLPWMEQALAAGQRDRCGAERSAVRPADRCRRRHGPGDGHLADDPAARPGRPASADRRPDRHDPRRRQTIGVSGSDAGAPEEPPVFGQGPSPLGCPMILAQGAPNATVIRPQVAAWSRITPCFSANLSPMSRGATSARRPSPRLLPRPRARRRAQRQRAR